MKILILAGGESRERDVSLNTARAIAEGLQSLGHDIKMIDTGDGKDLLAGGTPAQLLGKNEFNQASHALAQTGSSSMLSTCLPADVRDCDCVFIALHGGIGEDGTLQALLDLSGVAYTGSGVLASALAMDKYRAKLLFDSVGIPTPRTVFYGGEADAVKYCDSLEKGEFNFPIVVKPNSEGSTIGLTIATDYGTLVKGIAEAALCDTHILIEEYIPGRELTVAILGGEPLPVVEIIPKSGFYDYHAKYTDGESQYVCPAVLDNAIETEVKEYARLAFDVLGCAGYARVDFRLNPQNELFCLEVNTLPGMTATSLVPKAAKAAGLSFAQLLERIVGIAPAKGKA
jgi:D-alanine-D-alanine ligase